MRGALTSIYSSSSDRPALGNRVLRPFRLVRQAARDQKIAELASFAVWEALHRSRRYAAADYVRFRDAGALRLEQEDVQTLDSSPTAVEHWSRLGLSISHAQNDWRVLAYTNTRGILGSLGSDRTGLWKSTAKGRASTLLWSFPREIEAVFCDNRGVILVAVRGAIYRSDDEGETFHQSLTLSTPDSYLRHPYGMTELPNGTLLVGEYGNVRRGGRWLSIANLYVSSDAGLTWKTDDILKRTGANKHVHLVWYSELLNRVLVSDGDNKKRLWISDPVAADQPGLPPLNLVNRSHFAMGGYTSVTENGDRVLLGTDYMGGTNFMVDTTDGHDFTTRILPDPYRRSPIMQLLKRTSRSEDEIWALLPYATRNSPSLLMYSRDGGRHWTRVVEYGPDQGLRILGSATEGTPSLFLAVSDRERAEQAVYEIADMGTEVGS